MLRGETVRQVLVDAVPGLMTHRQAQAFDRGHRRQDDAAPTHFLDQGGRQEDKAISLESDRQQPRRQVPAMPCGKRPQLQLVLQFGRVTPLGLFIGEILTDEFGGETDLVRDELHHLGRRGFTVEQWPPRVVQIRQHYGTSQPIVVAAAPIGDYSRP